MELLKDGVPAYRRSVELLQHLIRFDTTNPPGNEVECVSFIDGLLKEAGIETTIRSRNPQRPNLVARLPGQGNALPLLLYGHLDVVTVLGLTLFTGTILILLNLVNDILLAIVDPRIRYD